MKKTEELRKERKLSNSALYIFGPQASNFLVETKEDEEWSQQSEFGARLETLSSIWSSIWSVFYCFFAPEVIWRWILKQSSVSAAGCLYGQGL